MRRASLRVGVVLAFGLSVPAEASFIFESATLGATGQSVGLTVSDSQLVGARFEVASRVDSATIGGHFDQTIPGQFFGTVVALSGPDDFPDSSDLSTSDVLGSALITFPEPSEEVFASLVVTLTPGWYAVVFGSGLFGSSGRGVAPENNPDIGSPSYFFRDAGGTYRNASTGNKRFFLTAIPEPSTALLLGGALLAQCVARRRIRRP